MRLAADDDLWLFGGFHVPLGEPPPPARCACGGGKVCDNDKAWNRTHKAAMDPAHTPRMREHSDGFDPRCSTEVILVGLREARKARDRAKREEGSSSQAYAEARRVVARWESRMHVRRKAVASPGRPRHLSLAWTEAQMVDELKVQQAALALTQGATGPDVVAIRKLIRKKIRRLQQYLAKKRRGNT